MVLYFTRVMHLSSDEVGLGMTIAGLVGLIAGVPIGDLADRYGPRVVVRATFLVSFFTTVGFLLVRDFAAFVAVATVDMLAMNANGAADGALLRRVGGVGGGDATVFRSANLLDRIAEAEREGWLGEVEGLQVSLAGADDKLTQITASLRRTADAVQLGMPAFPDIAGRSTSDRPVVKDAP